MPIFNYQCVSCNKIEEHIEKFDAPVRVCECSYLMKRLLSAPALFNFKGEGFYQNDGKHK